jgi:hypothetical protein
MSVPYGFWDVLGTMGIARLDVLPPPPPIQNHIGKQGGKAAYIWICMILAQMQARRRRDGAILIDEVVQERCQEMRVQELDKLVRQDKQRSAAMAVLMALV